MKLLFKNILVYTLALFVVSISVGFNISKINCHQNISVYIGNIEDKCHSQSTNIESALTNEVSCCSVLEEITCSSSFNCMCEKKLSNIHFNFQTLLLEKSNFSLLSVLKINFKKVVYFLPYLWCFSLSSEAPLIIHKPLLSKTQSFVI